MSRFSNEEYSDMLFLYGLCNGNGNRAADMYRRRYPNRRHPNGSTIRSVYRRLRETGQVQSVEERVGQQISVEREEEVISMIANDPGASTRDIARRTQLSHSTVYRILRRENLHPYHLQRVQCLQEPDFQHRVNFSLWLREKWRSDALFLRRILYTDESTFTRAGVTNLHNLHTWSHENPHTVRQASFQQEFSVNVWAGIIDGYLIGPYVLEGRLTAVKYLEFLENNLPELLEDVPLRLRRSMWFQHDGAPPHFGRQVRTFLNQQYPNRWIGRGGPVNWPARSPDLNPLDYFLWGYLKEKIYYTEVTSRDDLISRIENETASLKGNRQLVSRVHRSMQKRCRLCIECSGQHFQHFL